MNRTSAAAARTHAVFPLSVNGASAVTKVSALMARTMDGPNFGRPRRLLQPCQQPVGVVSGWFPAPWASRSWTPRASTGRHDHVCRPAHVLVVVGRERASSHDDGVDEGLGVEGGEVVGALAEADELDRHTELALDRDDDAALGGAVELGQDDARDVDRLGEDLGLLETVLPGRRVEDEEHLVDGALLLDDALDLAELVHEADLVVEAAGGVDDDDVDLLLDTGFDGVEGDGRRVGAVLVGPHGGDPDTGAPRLELVGRRSAEGVGRTEDDLAVLGHEDAGELADGRRLAGAVDAHDEDDGGPLADAAARDATVHVGLDEREQVLTEPAADGGLVGGSVDLDARAQRVDELHGHLDAEGGGDE